MKKLLAIVFLGLLLTSCNQTSSGEYFCKNIMQKGYDDMTLEITKKTVRSTYTDGLNFTYSILKETKDIIIFGYTGSGENQTRQTFYKKTKKFKWESSYDETTKNYFMIIRDCQKLK